MKRYSSLLARSFFLLLILSGCTRPTPTPMPTKPANSSVVISTFTPVPGSPAPLETSMPALVASPTPGVIGELPDLSPANVTVGLEERQFTCTAMKKVAIHYERVCTKGLPQENLFTVVISGRESFLVDFIEASVKQQAKPDNEIALSLLGFLATMPYKGAAPEDAQAWVQHTIATLSEKPGEAQEIVFGGVKYVLSGTPAALTLEMGELP